MRRKAVTIRDVAKRAGVGISTVSYVLNGNEDHVGAATRDQILEAARELNYRPNAIARSMVRKKTATIGLIITELENQLFVPVTVGVEEVLRLEGYQIILARAPDIESERKTIETLRAHQVDGIIIMSLSLCYPADHLRKLVDEEFPFVVINRDLQDPDINLIQYDDYRAGFAATEYLINLGHSRIGAVYGLMEDDWQRRRRSAIERDRGWRDVMTAYHLSIVPEWVAGGNYTYEGGYTAIQRMLVEQADNLPTAFFVASDMMTMGALKAIYEAGLRVPDDFAIITLGDPPFAAYTIPALTTLSLPVVESGQVAARMLVDWIQSGKPPKPQSITLNYTLKVRESCGTTMLRR